MIPGVPRRKETTGWMVVLGVIPFLIFCLSHQSQVNLNTLRNLSMDSKPRQEP